MTSDITPLPIPAPRRYRTREVSDLRLRVLTLVGLAIVQAIVVGVSGGGITRILAVLLALPAFSARLRTLSLLSALIVVNFLAHSAALPPSLPLRLAHLAVMVAYAAVVLAAVASAITRVRFAHTLALTGGLGVLFLSAEAVAGTRVTPPMRVTRYPRRPRRRGAGRDVRRRLPSVWGVALVLS